MRNLTFLLALLLLNIQAMAQNIFDLNVHKIEIFFNINNWDDSLDIFYSNNLGERLIADSILIDGKIDQDVGVKFKGNSSYSANNNKNPLNIKLDYVNNGQSINGYNVLKLSNGFRDPSFIREVMSYDMAREYMPSPLATYANVFINGTLIGIYTCIQSIDDDFTNQHFYERKGPFFKAENTGFSVSGCAGPLGVLQYFSDTNCYQRAYEMQSTDDWTQLGNFLDTLNNHFTELENILDLDRTLWMMAFENLTVSLDGPINSIPHNFYLFKDNNGRFSPILWDMNMAFGGFTMGLPGNVQNSDLQELDIFHDSSNNQNKLTNKIFSSNRYRKMYVAHMRTILNEQFVNGFYNTKALALQSLISNDVNNDPNTFYSFADFNSNTSNSVSNIIGISELIASRISYLQNLSEFTASTPIISNISTSTNTVLPFSTVNFTSDIVNANYAYFAYRYNYSDKFQKVEMFDDGQHNDGIAGDNVFGINIDVDARDMQYYIYAENNNSGVFSPERAEKEFHKLAVVGGLVINEVMASNTSVIADQNGEFDDWVELYNNNNFSINLNGYYLSDNENDLLKWSFPNVSIAPNSYLIVWCDTAGSSQTGLHTNFRLSSDQEEVYLTDPLGNIIDAIHYVNMPSNISFSRVPNGIGPFVNQESTFSSSNNNISNINEELSIAFFNVYPNPINENFIIHSLNVGEISIFNVCGQKILTKKLNGFPKTINSEKWKPGIYFITNGYLTQKIIKQ